MKRTKKERKEPQKRTNFHEQSNNYKTMEQLKNVNVSMNFNLRQPTKKGASVIYCVIAVNGRQSKIPMGVKVNAYQWNKRQQLCTIAANMTEQDLQNNMAVNRVLNEVRFAYNETFIYLCGPDMEMTDFVDTFTDKIKRITNDNKGNDMANKNAIPPKRTITATTLLNRAFEKHYEGVKESTVNAQRQLLKSYLDYINENPKGDTPKNFLTQKALNEYKEHLRNEGNTSGQRINRKCQMVEMLVRELSETADGIKYGITPITYTTIKDSRKKDDSKKRALTSEEVKAVQDCKTLTEKEREYRDVFTMQIETGVRVSDLPKLFNGDYTVNEYEGQPCYILMTQKEGITAVIIVNDTISQIQQRYKAGFSYVKFDRNFAASYYNTALKQIFKKAGLDSVETYYIDVNGKKVEHSHPLHEVITNHWARHTFITNKLREGYSPDKLAYLTGHADSEMIQRIYSHLTNEDKARAAVAEFQRVQGTAKPQTLNTGTDSEIIANQARENYRLKTDLELVQMLKEWRAKLNSKHDNISIALQMVAGGGNSLDKSCNLFNYFFADFPNADELQAIKNGKDITDVANERFKQYGISLNEKFQICRRLAKYENGKKLGSYYAPIFTDD